MADAPAARPLDGLAFAGSLRRYQEQAAEAYAADVAAGRRTTYIVAPPGSGKTVLGLEVARRTGGPAVVLSPTTAVQEQWLRAVSAFLPAGADPAAVAGPEPDRPLVCLTYQALCQLDDPATLLGDLALARWAAERARAAGTTVEAARAEAAGLEGAAATRLARDLARIRASLTRELARGEHAGAELADLLAPGARARIAAIAAAGPRLVVLDECHHLASLWGHVVRVLLDALPDAHVLGLTATPPDALPRDAALLYQGLLGEIDHWVPTPAVVRDGVAAPYQELAWLCAPEGVELAWLEGLDGRFAELVRVLCDPREDDPPPFPVWLHVALRGEGEDGEARDVWGDLARRRPAFARAAARFLHASGADDGVPAGEEHSVPPDEDDWLLLIEEYAQRCLRVHPSPRAAERLDELAAGLRVFGWSLTRQGLRRAASPADRLLAASRAKTEAVCAILDHERDVRGAGLRAVVVCDAEVAEAGLPEALADVADAQGNTARALLAALAADPRTTALTPVLVTARGLRCAALDAGDLAAALADLAPGATLEDAGDGTVALLPGAGRSGGSLALLAAALLARGATRAVIGTRGLLAEGWDAPAANCLVDLTGAATSVATLQLRGRSLRLDPADPQKLATNWDVVCVGPGAFAGGDYARLVRRHAHVLAPCEDGAIEAGVSHVHPTLSPFHAPPPADVPALVADMRSRAADLAGARARWAIGTPYAGEEAPVALVRRRRGATADPDVGSVGAKPRPSGLAAFSALSRLAGGGAVALAGAGAVGAVGAASAAADAGALAVLAGVLAVGGVRRARRERPAVLPLERAARAVCDAYVALGELRPDAAATLELAPRASGFIRCDLPGATPEEAGRFARALAQAVAAPERPRYLVTRRIPRTGALGQVLRLGGGWLEVYHPVPDDLGRHRDRADAYAAAFHAWLGPGRLVFAQRDPDALAAAQARGGDHEAVERVRWR